MARPPPRWAYFTQVSAGDAFTCALRDGGTVACWGLNTDGQIAAPADLFIQVSAGGAHACGLKIEWHAGLLGPRY